ncbi:DUF4232 domain-containing protein [Isoptericola sp. BMS4]|uniref:DUF4232 domain-containing protein n=1 Tax=Isoptericola sp. BMS4 TaxID=2527875 RepID=UPI0014222135|nr:DUF4232 domain-containing protein [Isoptericola sp. BMS4]
MTRRRTSWLVAALLVAAGAAAVLTWRPWDPVPDELRAVEREVADLPGVVEVSTDYAVVARDPLDGDAARSTVTVRLDEALAPGAAGRAAERAATLVDGARVPGTDLTASVVVEAGEPTAFGGAAVPPVSVRGPSSGGADDTPTDPAADLSTRVVGAFTLWRGGTARVGTADAVSSDAGGLVGLARLAADEELAVSVGTADGTVSYDGYGGVPDVAAVRLAVDAVGRDAVTTAVLADSAEPRLSVGLDVAADAPPARALVRWLEDPARAAGLGRPVAYTVSEPGYATLLDGWVGGVAPPEPAEHTVPVPDDVAAWPADADAPACAGGDLDLALSTPDAATGSRYLAVLATNVSGRPCALDGVPGLVFRNADGEPQRDVTLTPSAPGVVPGRVVVPDGERARATLEWRAMSTANDPDVTTSVEVTPVPGADAVRLVPADPAGPGADGPTTLDVLDGAEVRAGPWVQAAEGWS